MSTVYIACSMIKSAGIDFSLLDLLEEWIEKQNLIPFTPGKMEDTEPEIVETPGHRSLRLLGRPR